MPSNVSRGTGPPPGLPHPGWRPNSTVGTTTGSIPIAANASACAEPPTRLAATWLEMTSARFILGERPDAVDVAHLAAGLGVALAVEVDARVRLGGVGRPAVRLIAQQVGHLDA